MVRIKKLYINYAELSGKSTAAANADDVDLMILAALCLTATPDGEVSEQAVEALGRFEGTEISSALKFWRGAGVICAEARSARKDEGGMDADKKENAPRAVRAQLVAYTTAELADVLEHKISKAFVEEAGKAMGKVMTNSTEISRLIAMVDQLGFEEEAVLAILGYCARLDKKGIAYAEKVALGFFEEGIIRTEDVHAHIDMLEKRGDMLNKIKKLYGFGGRALSANEKKLFTAWNEVYGFDYPIIEKAYNITVDTTHEAAPKYADAILKKWYERGLRTEAEIDAFILSDRQEFEQKKKTGANAPRTAAAKDDKGREAEEWFYKKLEENFG